MSSDDQKPLNFTIAANICFVKLSIFRLFIASIFLIREIFSEIFQTKFHTIYHSNICCFNSSISLDTKDELFRRLAQIWTAEASFEVALIGCPFHFLGKLKLRKSKMSSQLPISIGSWVSNLTTVNPLRPRKYNLSHPFF